MPNAQAGVYPSPPNGEIGIDPQGNAVSLGAQGLVAYSIVALGANDSWSTGWKKYNVNGAVAYSVSSNVAGSVKIEYSENGVDPVGYAPALSSYNPAISPTLKNGFPSTGQYAKVTYVNGPAAQSAFFIEVRFVDQLQPTVRTIATLPTNTNIAQLVSGPITTRDANGEWGHVLRDADGMLTKATLSASSIAAIAPKANQPVSGIVSASARAGQVQLPDGTFADVQTAVLTVGFTAGITVVAINQTSAIVAATAGKRIVLLGYGADAVASLNYQVKMGTTAVTRMRTAGPNRESTMPPVVPGYAMGGVGEALNVTISGTLPLLTALTAGLAVNFSIDVRYVLI